MKRVHPPPIGSGLLSLIRARYLKLGARGRASKLRENFNAKNSELHEYFDAEWYLETNADVADAGVDPLRHFLEQGEEEGRNPSRAFSTTYYRNTYMQGQPPGASPLRHFVSVGRDLGIALKYALRAAAQNQSYGLEVPELLQHIQMMPIQPLFLVYSECAETTFRSRITAELQSQIYPNWRVCDSKQSVLQGISAPAEKPSFLVWLGPDDALHSSAFYSFASAINANPEVDVIYGDEDQFTGKGDRSNPFFKPDWSPDYLESCNFLGGGTCVRGTIVDRFFGNSDGMYDFLLRTTEITQRIIHIRQVLVHRARGLDKPLPPDRITSDIAALEGRLKRTGRAGKVTALKRDIGCYRIHLSHSGAAPISVVIPTHGRIVDVGGRKVDLILNCVDSILSRSTYKKLEFVVVDNGDISEARVSKLRGLGVKTIIHSDRGLNAAGKVNLGAAACHHTFLLLLGDNVEPRNEDWIERLLDHIHKPHVGVVGAKLLESKKTTEDLGIVMLNGLPSHLRVTRPDGDYFFNSCSSRNLTAVSGKAMLTRASLYQEVGGFTETMPASYIDADYCLKLREIGSYAVFSADAELIHYADAPDQLRIASQSENEYFTSRWASIVTDPFYNEQELTGFDSALEVGPYRPLG